MNLKKSINIALAHKEKNTTWLAERMGVSKSWVHQMKTNESVTTKTLERVADALDMTVIELLELGE